MADREHLPWTTARCNRLLRPISSRLVALRKIALRRQLPPSPVPAAEVETETEDAGAENTESRPAPPLARAATRKHSTGLSSDTSDVDNEDGQGAQDPDWVPGGAMAVGRKRAVRQRKYSGRLARDVERQRVGKAVVAKRRVRPGEIEVATPLIARCARGTVGVCERGDVDGGGEGVGVGTEREMEGKADKARKRMLGFGQQKNMLSEEAEMTFQLNHLFEGVAHLLAATKEQGQNHSDQRRPDSTCRQQPQGGAPSLLDMCLRRVPAYIKMEQDWRDEHDADDIDSSSEIYAELEFLGAAEGWKHLRKVVRAHGIELLVHAIHERTIPSQRIRTLAATCRHQGALAEAEYLLSAWVQTMRPLPQPAVHDASFFGDGSSSHPAIAALHEHAQAAGRWAFFYQKMADMLLTHRLPIAWVATTDFMSIWTRAVRSVSMSQASEPDSVRVDAVRLLRTVLMLGCGRTPHETGLLPAEFVDEELARTPHVVGGNMQEAVTNTITSLSTIFTSYALVDMAEESRTSEPIHRSFEFVALDLVHLARSNSSTAPGPVPSAVSHRQCLILLSSLLLSTFGYTLPPSQNPGSSHLIHHRVKAIDSIAQNSNTNILHSLPSFICSLARCCGKWFHEDDFTHLQSIVAALTATPAKKSGASISHSTSTPRWFLRRLAFDAVLEWAEHSNQAAHFAYARQVEGVIQSGGANAASPFKKCDAAESLAGSSPVKDGQGGQSSVGFRWEAGLSEWVACTPVVQRRRGARKTRQSPFVRVPRWEMPVVEDEDEAEMGGAALEGEDMVSISSSSEVDEDGTESAPTDDDQDEHDEHPSDDSAIHIPHSPTVLPTSSKHPLVIPTPRKRRLSATCRETHCSAAAAADADAEAFDDGERECYIGARRRSLRARRRVERTGCPTTGWMVPLRCASRSRDGKRKRGTEDEAAEEEEAAEEMEEDDDDYNAHSHGHANDADELGFSSPFAHHPAIRHRSRSTAVAGARKRVKRTGTGSPDACAAGGSPRRRRATAASSSSSSSQAWRGDGAGSGEKRAGRSVGGVGRVTGRGRGLGGRVLDEDESEDELSFL